MQVPLNPEAEDPEAYRKEEQERIDSAMPLTEEETTEKEKLLQEVSSLSLGVSEAGVSVAVLGDRGSLNGAGEISTSL